MVDVTLTWPYASLAKFFIIPDFFFFFQHKTKYTTRVLAMFDFYYRKKTERENLHNLECPFCFLFFSLLML